MDDDVRTLTVKCREAIGMENPYHPGDTSMGAIQRWNDFNPAENDDQAFELLCWLAKEGCVQFDFSENYFLYNSYEIVESMEFPCFTPAELRLAIMRAVCKVKEGK